MSPHTVRPLLQTQSDENNNRLVVDVLDSINLRTIEHYNIIHPMDENNNRIVVDIHLTIEDNGWRVVIQ